MKLLLTILGIIAILAGMFDFIAPDYLLSVGKSLMTPMGIYIVAAVRVLVGILFHAAARTSRLPGTLRVLGFVVLLAGIATPIFGVARSIAVFNWWSSQNALVLRAPSVILATVGAFIIYAMGVNRRVA